MEWNVRDQRLIDQKRVIRQNNRVTPLELQMTKNLVATQMITSRHDVSSINKLTKGTGITQTQLNLAPNNGDLQYKHTTSN